MALLHAMKLISEQFFRQNITPHLGPDRGVYAASMFARLQAKLCVCADQILKRPEGRAPGTRADPSMVGRHSVEPTFERSEANVVSILPLQQGQDARFARASFVGSVGSKEPRPTEIWRRDAGLPGEKQITQGKGKAS